MVRRQEERMAAAWTQLGNLKLGEISRDDRDLPSCTLSLVPFRLEEPRSKDGMILEAWHILSLSLSHGSIPNNVCVSHACLYWDAERVEAAT